MALTKTTFPWWDDFEKESRKQEQAAIMLSLTPEDFGELPPLDDICLHLQVQRGSLIVDPSDDVRW